MSQQRARPGSLFSGSRTVGSDTRDGPQRGKRSIPTLPSSTVLQMDHVGVAVDDLLATNCATVPATAGSPSPTTLEARLSPDTVLGGHQPERLWSGTPLARAMGVKDRDRVEGDVALPAMRPVPTRPARRTATAADAEQMQVVGHYHSLDSSGICLSGIEAPPEL
jgi:hypothetical protein